MIYIVGSSRSGTTMLSRILGKHPEIFSFRELHFFEQLTDKYSMNSLLGQESALLMATKLLNIQRLGFLSNKKANYSSESKAIISRIPEGDLTPVEIFKCFLEYETQLNSKTIACDQTPRNNLYIEEILSSYSSDCKIICMVRDPRAVLLSQKNKWRRKFRGASAIPLKESIRSYFNYHPYTITKLWTAAIRETDKWKNNENVLVVKFEELVSNPEDKIKGICRFIGVHFHEDMLDVPHVGSSNIEDRDIEKKGINNTTMNVWKNGGLKKSEIYICEKISRKYIESYGFDDTTIKKKPFIGIVSQSLLFPIKMSVALILNLKRMKNIKQAILKRL